MRGGAARLLVCDEAGRIYDRPEFALAGQLGKTWVPVPEDDLVPLPDGTKVFFLPESAAVGWDEAQEKPKVLRRFRAVGAMLQAGYTRTHLPAASYRQGVRFGSHAYLPLWAYACVGWRDGKMVAAAFRVDPLSHSETCHYDDR